MHTRRWSNLVCCLFVITGCLGAPDDTPDVTSQAEPLELFGALSYAPAAVRSGPDTIDVFAGGDDSNVWTRRFTESSGTWSNWAQVDSAARVGSGLAVVRDQAGGLKLFSRHKTLNTVMSLALRWSGSSWAIAADWRPLSYGGLLAFDAPAAVIDGLGVIHVFASNRSSNALIHTTCSTAANCNAASPAWTTWDEQSLRIFGSPSVVSLVPGQFNLYFKSKEGRTQQSLFRPIGDGTLFAPSWSAPQDLDDTQYAWTSESTGPLNPDYTPATAVPVSGRAGLHQVRNVLTNPAGTSGAQGSCGGLGAEGVMRFTLAETSRVQLDTRTASYDTVLYVRDTSGAQVVDRFGVSACNDDDGFVLQSALDLTLPAGTYYVYADAYGAGAVGANRNPLITMTITPLNAPVAVVRTDSGLQAIDVYSVNLDGRLYTASINGPATSPWKRIDALDSTREGDLQNTVLLSAVPSSWLPGCSQVFGRAFPSRNLFTKGCGELSSLGLDNNVGATFASGPVPTRFAVAYSHPWGQLNSAWNQGTSLGAAASAPWASRVTYTGAANTDVLLFNFDDRRTDWSNAWSWDTSATWARLGPATPLRSWWEAAPGTVVTEALVSMSGGVKSARVIDHGSCVTRIPWDDGLPYGAGGHTGLLNSIQAGVTDGLAMAATQGLFEKGATHVSRSYEVNRYTPTFAHFAVDPVTGNHSDGIAFQNTLNVAGNNGLGVKVEANAQYVFGLDQGVPRLHMLSKFPKITPSASVGYVLSFLYNLSFTPAPFGVEVKTAPDGTTRRVGEWGMVFNELLAEGVDPCGEGGLDCLLQTSIPSSVRSSFKAGMTVVLGDPMLAKECTTVADCGPAPATSGDVWECHNNRCLVPIRDGGVGYSATTPNANYRTEFDLYSAPPTGDCTPTSGALDTSSLRSCQALVSLMLKNKGLSLTEAEALAFDPSMVANGQYGCVKPQRPNCGGDSSIPGYWCHDRSESEQYGTGLIDARCTWRPAFKRLNVLPTSLELVWSERGEQAVSERIVRALSPPSACSAPATYGSTDEAPIAKVEKTGSY